MITPSERSPTYTPCKRRLHCCCSPARSKQLYPVSHDSTAFKSNLRYRNSQRHVAHKSTCTCFTTPVLDTMVLFYVYQYLNAAIYIYIYIIERQKRLSPPLMKIAPYLNIKHTYEHFPGTDCPPRSSMTINTFDNIGINNGLYKISMYKNAGTYNIQRRMFYY